MDSKALLPTHRFFVLWNAAENLCHKQQMFGHGPGMLTASGTSSGNVRTKPGSRSYRFRLAGRNEFCPRQFAHGGRRTGASPKKREHTTATSNRMQQASTHATNVAPVPNPAKEAHGKRCGKPDETLFGDKDPPRCKMSAHGSPKMFIENLFFSQLPAERAALVTSPPPRTRLDIFQLNVLELAIHVYMWRCGCPEDPG